MDNLDKHALAFGRLVGNLLSLEFLLRVFLFKTAKNFEDSFPDWDNFHALKEGDSITLNAFTRDKYFRDVVRRYNKYPKIEKGGMVINNNLVVLRNALAHGMIWGDNPSPPLRLLNFDNKRDKVSVKLNVLLTSEWFTEQNLQVRLAIENVEQAIKLLESNEF